MGSGPSFDRRILKSDNGPRCVTFSVGRSVVYDISFGRKDGLTHTMAVSAGPRVGLFSGSGLSNLNAALRASTAQPASDVKPDRSAVTQGLPANCSSFRPTDGRRLLAIGTDKGRIIVSDTASRATLRTFITPSSSNPIRSIDWTPNGKFILSAGDDAALRIWNLADVSPTAAPLLQIFGHSDSVRSVLAFTIHDSDTPTNVVATGSYDHTIRLWDITDFKQFNASNHTKLPDRDRCLSVMEHGAPVEKLLLFRVPPRLMDQNSSKSRSKTLIISAGGTTLKVWDPMAAKCLRVVQTKHSKSLTSMSLVTVLRDETSTTNESSKHQRLITAGLDGLIRIHDVVISHPPNSSFVDIDFPYLHGIPTPHAISSLAISPDHGHRIAIGTTEGLVTVYQRRKILSTNKKRSLAATTQDSPSKAGDFVIPANGSSATGTGSNKRQKLSKADMLLRRFRYGDALDAALESRNPELVAGILEELGKRRGLATALSNRDEETLEPVISFVSRYIAKPQYSITLVGVASMLCDIYQPVMGQSEMIDDCFEKLKRVVREECRVQKESLRLVGLMDAVLYQIES